MWIELSTSTDDWWLNVILDVPFFCEENKIQFDDCKWD